MRCSIVRMLCVVSYIIISEEDKVQLDVHTLTRLVQKLDWLSWRLVRRYLFTCDTVMLSLRSIELHCVWTLDQPYEIHCVWTWDQPYEIHCVWTLDQPYEESYEWYVGSMTCGDRINHIIAGPQHSFANFQY